MASAPDVAKLRPTLVAIYGTTLADTLGYTLMIPLLPVVAQQYGAPDTVVGSLLSIPAFCSMLAAPVWGKLSDRIGRKNVIVAAQVLSLAGYLVLALSHSLALVFLSRIVSGLGGGSLGSVEGLIADVTTEKQRDRAYAMYGAVFGMAFVIGPVASGALAGFGIGLPFFIAAALELVNIVFTLRFLPQPKRFRTGSSIRDSLRAISERPVRRLLVCHFLFIFAVVSFLANFALYLDRILRLDVSASSGLLASAGAIGGVALLVSTPLARSIGDRRMSYLGLTLSLALSS